MAPILTSNSFLLTSTSHSTLFFKNQRVSVFAKKGDDSSTKESQSSGNSSPFRLNFGNLPDVKTIVPAVSNPSSGLSFGRRKDPGTVFVAGATGQAGIRIAQTLLRQGFSVRAGVPDIGSAQELARLAVKYKIISNDQSKRLNAVDSTFQDAESIAKAIGNASKVVVTVGPAENGPNAEVTPSDALQVIQGAQLANVGHVAIVYDGSSSVASTYNVLDGITSFFSNIFSRSQPMTMVELLQKVVETDINYTLIKTKLAEDYSPESSYNVVVLAEGSTAGANDYKVAKTQIASLVANVFSNTAIAENKVVEVFTDPSASSKDFYELFGAIPKDGRREAYAEALAKAEVQEEAIRATEQAREAAEAAKKLEEEASSLAARAQNDAEAAETSVESLLDKAKGMTSGLNWEKFSLQLKSAVLKPEDEEEPKIRIATVQGQAKARSLPSRAQNGAEAAETSVENLLDKAKGMTSGLNWEKFSLQLKSAVLKPEDEEEPKIRIATVRGQAKARSLPSQKAVVKTSARQPPPLKSKVAAKVKTKQPEPPTEKRKFFGGLFQQETIYVDDD